MKNKLLILTGILIKNGEGFGVKDGKRSTRMILLIVLAVSFIPLAGMLAFTISGMMDALAMIGQEGVILSWGLVLCSFAIFIFGIFYIISSFYFATDVENLIPLPLRPRQIVGAKFLVVMVYEYLITAFVFFPLLLVYGIKSGSGPVFYLYGLIILLFIPVIPLTLSSILVMLMMRFTSLRRHRDIFSIIGGVLAIFVGLGFNMFIQKFTVNVSAEELQKMLMQGENSLAVLSTGIFPTVSWAVKALLGGLTLQGLLNLMLYVGVSVLVFVILLYLGELVYFKGVIGISESGSSRKRNGAGLNDDKAFAMGNAVWTYAMTEFRLLYRTPIYFLNCVLISFIWPVFFLFPLLMQTEEISIIQQIAPFLSNPDLSGVVLCGAFALSLFLGGTNAVASTAISREGQDLYIKRYLPISYRDQIKAKINTSLGLGYTSILMMLIAAVAVMKLPLYMALLILATSWMGVRLMSFTGILIDIHNPKLKWNSEQQAVKQNMNVVFNMLIGMGLAGGTMFLATNLALDLWVSLVGLFVVYGGLNILFTRLVYTIGVKRFEQLEG